MAILTARSLPSMLDGCIDRIPYDSEVQNGQIYTVDQEVTASAIVIGGPFCFKSNE